MTYHVKYYSTEKTEAENPVKQQDTLKQKDDIL